MAIKTVKTKYYNDLLYSVKKRRGNMQSITPTGEQYFIDAGQYDNTTETSSASSIQRQETDIRFVTLEVKPIRSTHPVKPVSIKKKTGKLPKFFRNISHVFGKKVTHSFPLAKLVFRNGELAGKNFFIYNKNPPANPGGYIKIGRRGERTPGERYFIPLSSRTVSRNHAKIVYLNHELIIVNYSNVNPTQVNGKIMPINASAYIQYGDAIKIGEMELTIEKVLFD